MNDRVKQRWTYSLMVAFVIAAVIFTLWPEIDLSVSGWFYSETQGFWLADWTVIKLIHEAIYLLMVLTVLGSLGMIVLAFFGIHPWDVPLRLWVYVASLFFVGPLLLANAVFKEHWGRARPAHVEEFGGSAEFTPALRWAEECDRNCSFVSGEGP